MPVLSLGKVLRGLEFVQNCSGSQDFNFRLPDSKVHMLNCEITLSNYPKLGTAKDKAETVYGKPLAQSLGHAASPNGRSYYYSLFFLTYEFSLFFEGRVRITTFSLGEVIGTPDVFCFVSLCPSLDLWQSLAVFQRMSSLFVCKPYHLNRSLTSVPP